MEKTYQNLGAAFLGECQARNRYTFYASTAKKEGFEQIAAIFLETADQEREHASNLYKLLVELKKKPENAGTLDVTQADMTVVRGTTAENLVAAITGEDHEWSAMYPDFADMAEKEGYPAIATRLRAIAVAEKHHSERYQKLLALVESGTVFKRETEQIWVCRECGYVHIGKQPPMKCPSCDHATSFYQVECETY